MTRRPRMSDLDGGQYRRAKALASDVGLSDADAAAMVAIWDDAPAWQRWIGVTVEERAELRTANPEYAADLDQEAERETGGRWRRD